MKPRLEPRPNNLFAITCGPLVYSLPLGENWIRTNEDKPNREPPHCDYEVYPTTPWNYGLYVPDDGELRVERRPVGECPFSPRGAPNCITVSARKVDWNMESGSATPIPRMGWISNRVEEIRLVPYGCTNLRMTEMPKLKQPDSALL